MKTRIITAIVALIVFLPLLFLGGEYFKYTTYFLGILAMYEIIKMTYKKPHLLTLIFTGLIGTSIYNFLLVYNTREQVIIYLISFVAIILLLATVVATKHEIKLEAILVIIFFSFYVYLGFYNLHLLRELGLGYVFYLLITIWFTDSFAYFGGMKFGKNKLAPTISPNKSIEGAIIGSLSSIVVAVVTFYATSIFSSLAGAIVITLIVSIIGQFGDLIESAYKRECDVKDSSNLLPGHGGIFDRFDSVILAAPTFILLMNFISLF